MNNMVTYVYWRYHGRYEDKEESLEEAMRRAFVDCEYNTAYTEEIIDGDKHYNRDDMLKYWEEKGWEDL
jgi:hypothetical protein